jgi:hypothetical protein
LADYPAAMTELLACLTEADAQGTPIFTSDIFNTHRLAHSPLYHEDQLVHSNGECTLGSPQNCYHIKGIVPIFIQSLYASTAPSFTCSGELDDTVPGTCVHHPGLEGAMAINAAGKQKISSASALVLSCALLPVGTCPTIQDGTGPLNFLYDLQLTR